MNSASFITGDITANTEQLGVDFGRANPKLGARGPVDQLGPDDEYLRWYETCSCEEKTNFGKALYAKLAEQLPALAKDEKVENAMFLYNAFCFLEGVRIKSLTDLLRTFCPYEKPLRDVFADRGDDLYSQFLLAFAVNQTGNQDDVKFWLQLLDHSDPEMVQMAMVGLREAGPEIALRNLRGMREKSIRFPELGIFNEEIRLLLDAYPEHEWAGLASEYVTDQELLEMIRAYDKQRYHLQIEELSGPNSNELVKMGAVEHVKRDRKRWENGHLPTMALMGLFEEEAAHTEYRR